VNSRSHVNPFDSSGKAGFAQGSPRSSQGASLPFRAFALQGFPSAPLAYLGRSGFAGLTLVTRQAGAPLGSHGAQGLPFPFLRGSG